MQSLAKIQSFLLPLNRLSHKQSVRCKSTRKNLGWEKAKRWQRNKPQKDANDTSITYLWSPPISRSSLSKSSDLIPQKLSSTNPEIIQQLLAKYPKDFHFVTFPHLSNCEYFLCGTLHAHHIANKSSIIVKDVIQTLKPHYVVVESCIARIKSDFLDEEEQKRQANLETKITFPLIVQKALYDRSIQSLSLSLLIWQQLRAAQILNSKLGDEIPAACQQAHLCGATVVIGDRLSDVTEQRFFDKLSLWEHLKLIFFTSWDLLTMNQEKLKQQLEREDYDNQDELIRVGPSLLKVMVSERDEYLAQTLYELSRVKINQKKEKVRIVAVIGAGHLSGVQKNLALTPLTDEKMIEISSSSTHKSQWPEIGSFHVLDLKKLFNKSNKGK